MSGPLLFFYGYGSEFNLRPLAEAMRGRGHRVEVLDPLAGGDLGRIDSLVQDNEETFFFTSAHLERDRAALAALYPEVNAVSPLEIIGRLKPRRSFFYPHDLTTPWVLGEHHYLGLFDCILAPLPEMKLYAHYYRALEVVGWIKLAPAVLELERDGGWVWLYSDFVRNLRERGPAGLYQRCAPLVEQGVRMKFPDWPGAAEVTSYFESQRSGSTLPPGFNTMEAIWRSRGVITNSCSSCVIEADLLGRPGGNITEPYQEPNENRRAFAQCRSLRFYDDPAQVDLAALAALPPAPRRLDPFDFDRVAKIIGAYL